MCSFSADDHQHMAHALQLAERGMYNASPNPRVGCLIVHGDSVVGQGWHQRTGEAHAETHALRQAGLRAHGATVYVTLEPCAHHGRTPPCTDSLIEAGVARVVIATRDPFPTASGRGVEHLRSAGIVVDIGLLREQARELNVGFFSRIERGRPFVRVKLAMSLDGRTALCNGESKWITGEAARQDVQHWRARSSAILTGSGTVVADNPRLTVRMHQAGDAPADAIMPLRVILDRQLRIPADSGVLAGHPPTLVLHGADTCCSDDRYARVELAAVKEVSGALDLNAVLTLLAAREINELHVEAGPTLCGALFAAGLVDELVLYIAPLLLGDAARPLLHLPVLYDMAKRWKLRTIDRHVFGDDLRLCLRPAH